MSQNLQQPVRRQVKHQHPRSVAAAIALAVEFDISTEPSTAQTSYQRRNWPPKDQRGAGSTSSQPQQQAQPSTRPVYARGPEYAKLPVIRLTAAERADRTRRGLCVYCQDKWVPNHACKRPFLAYMGGDLEEDVEELDTPEEQPEAEVITADLSHIYALEGRQRPEALELRGTIGAEQVVILVDTGSSHDFLHPSVAQRLSLPLTAVKPFRVYVGNGASLVCSHASLQTRVVIQSHVFLVDLHILPVHGPEVILGLAWLRLMRRVTSDFVDGTLEFVRNGIPICLKVASPIAQQVSLKTVASLWSLRGEVDMFELVAIPKEASQVTDSEPPQFLADLDPMVLAVLGSHEAVFRTPVGMPPSRPFDHRIHLLPNSKPVNVRPYRYPYFQKNEIEQQVKEMLTSGVIRPSQSPFSSPVLLIRKKDGTFRFYIDYRALNTATVPDHFPIPTSDELFDELGSARFFTKLDLRSGYHQICMHADDVFKTAFRTHDRHFEFMVMPFGLTNAPSTFQSAMNAIFRPLLRVFVIVFFDDILIYSPTLQSHVRHLHEVLTILKVNQFFVKMSNCVFCSTTVEYLGHLISEGQLKADPEKIAAMVKWPVPTTVKQLRGFLGLTGYYRRCIANYATIASPLTELLKKDAFAWCPAAETSFGALKAAMTSAPVLRLPDFSKVFCIETDASDFGVGAVLLQDDHPLAYFSKKLGPRRKVSSTYHKELYAIVEAVQKWRQYLLGREFVIRSDQKILKELLQQIIQTPDQQFYARKLMGYKFRIEYKTGASNRGADALSRRDMVPAEVATAEKPTESAELNLVAAEEQADTALLEMVAHPVPDIFEILMKEADVLADLLSIRALIDEGKADANLSFIGGLIYRGRRIYVGEKSAAKLPLLYEHHSTPQAGHPGVERTYRRIAAQFYWKHMRREVQKYVEACVECQTTKYSTQKPAGLLQPLPIPSQV